MNRVGYWIELKTIHKICFSHKPICYYYINGSFWRKHSFKNFISFSLKFLSKTDDKYKSIYSLFSYKCWGKGNIIFEGLVLPKTSVKRWWQPDYNVLGSSSIWTCRILNICCGILLPGALENIKTNIQYSKFDMSKSMRYKGQN